MRAKQYETYSDIQQLLGHNKLSYDTNNEQELNNYKQPLLCNDNQQVLVNKQPTLTHELTYYNKNQQQLHNGNKQLLSVNNNQQAESPILCHSNQKELNHKQPVPSSSNQLLYDNNSQMKFSNKQQSNEKQHLDNCEHLDNRERIGNNQQNLDYHEQVDNKKRISTKQLNCNGNTKCSTSTSNIDSFAGSNSTQKHSAADNENVAACSSVSCSSPAAMTYDATGVAAVVAATSGALIPSTSNTVAVKTCTKAVSACSSSTEAHTSSKTALKGCTSSPTMGQQRDSPSCKPLRGRQRKPSDMLRDSQRVVAMYMNNAAPTLSYNKLDFGTSLFCNLVYCYICISL